jgi:hypothetical protein
MLSPLPPRFAETRAALHRLAEQRLKPERERVTGRFGLRALPGGFGTAPFGEGVQVQVDGTDLVFRDGATVRREPLDVDADAAGALATWFAFGAGVLEELRAETPRSDEPTPPQLWPEHFDVAIELGSEADGRRAGYGASPGDEHHPEPYLYVTLWDARPGRSELWNATGFPGAELPYAELLAADDRRVAALDFFRTRRDALQTLEVAAS